MDEVKASAENDVRRELRSGVGAEVMTAFFRGERSIAIFVEGLEGLSAQRQVLRDEML